MRVETGEPHDYQFIPCFGVKAVLTDVRDFTIVRIIRDIVNRVVAVASAHLPGEERYSASSRPAPFDTFTIRPSNTRAIVQTEHDAAGRLVRLFVQFGKDKFKDVLEDGVAKMLW